MFIVVQHQISDTGKFWEVIKASANQIPAGLKVHSVLPNSDGTKAVCIWEAPDVKTVTDIVQGSVGRFSKNEFFSVEANNAVGLPQ